MDDDIHVKFDALGDAIRELTKERDTLLAAAADNRARETDDNAAPLPEPAWRGPMRVFIRAQMAQMAGRPDVDELLEGMDNARAAIGAVAGGLGAYWILPFLVADMLHTVATAMSKAKAGDATATPSAVRASAERGLVGFQEAVQDAFSAYDAARAESEAN